MKPGDIIKKILAPFVKGTKYEDCDECNKRRLILNNGWTKFINKVKSLFNKK